MRAHGRTTSTKADSFRRVEVITGVGRRRRWSDGDKARIVAESLDRTTTSSAVARRYGLHASQLFTWRQQLQRSAAATAVLGEQEFVRERACPLIARSRHHEAAGGWLCAGKVIDCL
jgi:transposase